MTNLRTRPPKLEYNNQRYVVYELCPVGNSNAEPAWYKDERKPKAAANRTLNKLKESVKKIDDVLKSKFKNYFILKLLHVPIKCQDFRLPILKHPDLLLSEAKPTNGVRTASTD